MRVPFVLGGKPLLLAVLLLSTSSSAGATPTRHSPLIDRAIEHHGGELYRSSVTELEICSKSGCSQVRAEVDGDRFDYHVTGQTRGGERSVHWTNQSLEVRQAGEVVAVAPGQAQAFKDWAMARIYFCFLPHRLDDPSVFKQELGTEDWGGRLLQKVKITFTPGSSTDASDEYMYWLDPETGQVEQFAYSYEGNPGGLRFRRALDHRRIGGLLFFDQENLGVEGEGLRVDHIDPDFVSTRMRVVSEIELKKIEVRSLHR